MGEKRIDVSGLRVTLAKPKKRVDYKIVLFRIWRIGLIG